MSSSRRRVDRKLFQSPYANQDGLFERAERPAF